MSADLLQLGDLTFTSRLLLGTGKFSDRDTMIRAIQALQVAIHHPD